jgi:SAM-dependent methyltransferase
MNAWPAASGAPGPSAGSRRHHFRRGDAAWVKRQVPIATRSAAWSASSTAPSRSTPDTLGLTNVEFREGLAEALPIADGWADVVISNGAINLCTDKQAVFAEIRRVLRPGGTLQFADIANSRAISSEALRDIDLWAA